MVVLMKAPPRLLFAVLLALVTATAQDPATAKPDKVIFDLCGTLAFSPSEDPCTERRRRRAGDHERRHGPRLSDSAGEYRCSDSAAGKRRSARKVYREGKGRLSLRVFRVLRSGHNLMRANCCRIKARALLFVSSAVALLATTILRGQQDTIPGAPLAGITSRELELFRLGRSDFLEVESATDGLGPVFNGTSCAQCHNIPAIGGTGTIVETRAGYRDEAGRFRAPPGGTLMHLFSVPPHNCQVMVYEEGNGSASGFLFHCSGRV
jgi:hypothetical protein